MTRNSGFSDIRTYAELETSLRLVQHQIQANKVSRQISGLMAGRGMGLRWTDVTLMVLRMLKRRLS